MRGAKRLLPIGLAGALLAYGCAAFDSDDPVPTAANGGGTSGDAGVLDAATSDAEAAVPLDKPDACASPRSRCIDFDGPEQTAAPFGFDALFFEPTLPKGALSIDPALPASAPNDLRVEALEGGAAQADVTIAENGLMPQRVHTSFRLRVDKVIGGTSASLHLLSLRCRDTSNNRVTLKLQADGKKLGLRQEASSGGLNPTDEALAHPEHWNTIDVVYDWTESALKVLVNDVALFAPQTMTPIGCAHAIVLRYGGMVVQGSGGGSGAGDYTVHFDDIVADWD